MPRRDLLPVLEDILEAIEKIRRYTEGMTYETFTDDDRTVDAVVRNITIIGEAARSIPEEVQLRHPEVPWAEMRGIRNVVVHQYFGVSKKVLWNTVSRDLPRLIPLLRRMQPGD